MTTWTNDELNKIGKADELEIAGMRKDGTLHSNRTIWVVRVGDDLYVRSVNGRGSDWFRGILPRHEGRIQAGGVSKEVTFVEVADPAVQEQISAAYNQKYGHYAREYVDPCLAPPALAATIRLVPNA